MRTPNEAIYKEFSDVGITKEQLDSLNKTQKGRAIQDAIIRPESRPLAIKLIERCKLSIDDIADMGTKSQGGESKLWHFMKSSTFKKVDKFMKRNPDVPFHDLSELWDTHPKLLTKVLDKEMPLNTAKELKTVIPLEANPAKPSKPRKDAITYLLDHPQICELLATKEMKWAESMQMLTYMKMIPEASSEDLAALWKTTNKDKLKVVMAAALPWAEGEGMVDRFMEKNPRVALSELMDRDPRTLKSVITDEGSTLLKRFMKLKPRMPFSKIANNIEDDSSSISSERSDSSGSIGSVSAWSDIESVTLEINTNLSSRDSRSGSNGSDITQVGASPFSRTGSPPPHFKNSSSLTDKTTDERSRTPSPIGSESRTPSHVESLGGDSPKNKGFKNKLAAQLEKFTAAWNR